MREQLPKFEDKDLRRSVERIAKAWEELRAHVLLGPLVQRARLKIVDYEPQNTAMFATVSGLGEIYVNPYNFPRTIQEWVFVLSHMLLHLAFGHTRQMQRGIVWNVACDCVVNEFLQRMRIGTMPEGWLRLPPGMPNDEEKLFRMWTENGGVPKGSTAAGTAVDMAAAASKANWADIFARAVRAAARKSLGGQDGETTPAQSARTWFIRNFPLLGSVLQLLKVVENAKLCERLGIRIAAVNPQRRELFVNPGWALNDAELRFVFAHLALHCGLCHSRRREGRDAFIWNAACDYSVNSWLLRMPALTRVTKAPAEGMLHSPEFTDLPPEEIYERLMAQEKNARKLTTFAAQGVCDLLESDVEQSGTDRLYVDALVRGYHLHTESGKGPLPFSLLDEIRALESPPPPWDVQLGKWFDEHIPPLERIRTYGRPSRRQSSTPGIARPRYVWPDMETAVKSTFGLVLDISGALKPAHAAAALGAIIAYALTRNIPMVRLVLSGAELSDLGMIAVDEIIQRMRISERSCTILQPAVELLDAARDFPEDAPILLVTGLPCDRVKTDRVHAFVVPERGRLTYRTDAPVFQVALEAT